MQDVAVTIPLRLRLKADGRVVEILPDGSEHEFLPAKPAVRSQEPDALYVRQVRAASHLTQTAFASRIGVPVETLRNWEQGKRMPRGPARALLAVIAHAPETVFAALARV